MGSYIGGYVSMQMESNYDRKLPVVETATALATSFVICKASTYLTGLCGIPGGSLPMITATVGDVNIMHVTYRFGRWERRFDQPQKYKPFVSRCVVQGNLEIGSLREVDVKSGLPATTSTERLELLDDDEHILSIKIIGGDHRLRSSTTH